MQDYEFICPLCKRIYDNRFEERQIIINNKWEFCCYHCKEKEQENESKTKKRNYYRHC